MTKSSPTLQKFHQEFAQFVKLQHRMWTKNEKAWQENTRWQKGMDKKLTTVINFFDHEILDQSRRISHLEQSFSN